MNRHDAKTEPSGIDEEQARVLDDIKHIASTPRQIGLMVSQDIATAELKDDFVDDINVMFSC
ncbi:MAG: type II toxin-antitoxin system prevent-host-death family antitoxin [Cyanobacteriota bacterium]|nr:type II toxin-antitoxin system prevent-host-death family antitoxin [Cyanobacteriota bacterium]